MSNMSYCRFNNTANDLRDCDDYVLAHLDSETERKGRERLIEHCISILEQLGLAVDDPENPEGIDIPKILDALDPVGDD